MTLNRRTFITSCAALIGAPRMLFAQPFVLRAHPVAAHVLVDGDKTVGLFGYNGSTPGPELRFTQGDRVDLQFQNDLRQGSSVHWHGIRIDNAMDGVPGMTQPMIEPGERFEYSFDLPDAGTYWYHAHNRSWEQVARGLYGPLIVQETTPPQVDHDITVILDDWRIERTGEMIEDFGNRHDFAHAGRLGTYARVIVSQTNVRRGDRVRLRIINTATARVFPLEISGIAGKIVALDGMPLKTPQDINSLMLAPAQRMDIIADVSDVVKFTFPTRQDPYELGEITIIGENPAPNTTPITALPAANVPTPSAIPDQTATLKLQGGAMGGRHDGDDIWALNGVSGLSDAPWQRYARGETVRITIMNETSFPHGIHLHGHHFHEILADGSFGPLRDTTLLQRGETRDIVCVFDNPGKWLLHCHMLEHQAAGMKTWIEVS